MRRRRPDGRRAAAALATGSARRVERGQCRERIDGCVFRCPVTLTADRLLGVGTVIVDGAIEQATVFHTDGLDRRWDWCPDADGSYDCAFFIAPNGDAQYVKFPSGESTAKPSQIYACRRVRS